MHTSVLSLYVIHLYDRLIFNVSRNVVFDVSMQRNAFMDDLNAFESLIGHRPHVPYVHVFVSIC